MVQALKVLEWPNAIKRSSPRTKEGLTQLTLAFKKLAVFHQPRGSTPATVTLPSSHASGPLLPFKVMAKDIDIKFRFHFESNRSTNNIEKVRPPPSLQVLMIAGMVLPTYPDTIASARRLYEH
jgi:hypothetical protein